MATIHLLLGPVGAGKSTLARGLVAERQAVFFELDAWMGQLFRPDRPEPSDPGFIAWYVERAERCVAQIWELALATLAAGPDVVLEIGLMERRQRERIYRQTQRAGVALVVHVVHAPRELRRERVLARNVEEAASGGRVVPEAIFEMASDRWEPVEAAEVERVTAAGFEVRTFGNGEPSVILPEPW